MSFPVRRISCVRGLLSARISQSELPPSPLKTFSLGILGSHVGLSTVEAMREHRRLVCLCYIVVGGLFLGWPRETATVSAVQFPPPPAVCPGGVTVCLVSSTCLQGAHREPQLYKPSALGSTAGWLWLTLSVRIPA